MIVQARLIKLATDDKLMEMNESIELGKIFLVDLNTKHEVTLHNTEYDKEHTKEVVLCVDGGWLPTEILEYIV